MTDAMDDARPDPGQVIWSRLARAPRRPQPSLSHDQIARAAIQVADAEGVRAVSMRKVAAKLGAGTMSLYRYVSTKDDLIDLMLDAVLSEVEVPGEDAGDWRAVLAEWARRIRALHHRHPWMAEFAVGRPSLGPNLLGRLERLMARVDGLGLEVDGMLDLVNTVSAFVVGFVQSELAEAEAQRRTGLDEAQWRERMRPWMADVLATGRYPYLERIVIEAEDFPDPDAVFERRLALVLDGLATNLPHHDTHPDQGAPKDAG